MYIFVLYLQTKFFSTMQLEIKSGTSNKGGKYLILRERVDPTHPNTPAVYARTGIIKDYNKRVERGLNIVAFGKAPDRWDVKVKGNGKAYAYLKNDQDKVILAAVIADSASDAQEWITFLMPLCNDIDLKPID